MPPNSPAPRRPYITAVLDHSSEAAKAREAEIAANNSNPFPGFKFSTPDGPLSHILGKVQIFSQTEQCTPKPEPEILFDFQKLPQEILFLILEILEIDKQAAALNSMARSSSRIYGFATRLLYRNITLRDLESSYLLFFSLLRNPRRRTQVLGFRSEVNWLDRNPLQRSTEVKSQLENFKESFPVWIIQELTENNIYKNWDTVTTLLIYMMTCVESLHFPRYFEAIDRLAPRKVLIRTWVEITARNQDRINNGILAAEPRVPLTKLRSLSFLPDSPNAENYFRVRPNCFSCLFQIKPFLRLSSLKVLRTILDEGVGFVVLQHAAGAPLAPPNQQTHPPQLPPMVQHGPTYASHLSHCTVRLEELEVVMRFKEIGFRSNVLEQFVNCLGKGSLKALKLRWLNENIYFTEFLSYYPPLHAALVPQQIMLPHELCWALRGVGDTLEELVLPGHERIRDPMYQPFGGGQAFPKLRLLQGTMPMLFGQYPTPTRGFFYPPESHAMVLSAVQRMPVALERLQVAIETGKLPSWLVGFLVSYCKWGAEEAR